MLANKEKSEKLIWWYEKAVRPFLEKYAKEKIGPLDNEKIRLEKIIKEPDQLIACFIGMSGIGKSTLLNALAADEKIILPAGGTGPLTAQATEVYFSNKPKFKVKYHNKNVLWKVIFALETQLKRDNKVDSENSKVSSDDIGSNLDDEEKKEVVDVVDSIEREREAGANSNYEAYLKQGKLIVTGDQFIDKPLSYIVDGLRIASGNLQKWDQKLDESDQKRVERVSLIYSQNKDKLTIEVIEDEDRRAFQSQLNDHVSGFLAPLIAHIEVGWPSDLLENGISLVDLPGVGVAKDSYRDVTRSFVRDKAKAIIVVVDRSGLTESTLELLITSGYWDRLVGSVDDPESDPCAMLVAVTRVDDTTQSKYHASFPDENNKKPKKSELFHELSEEIKVKMKDSFSDQLGKKLKKSENETVQYAREMAKENLLKSLEIFPLSVPEFKKILIDDEEDRSFLKSIDETGIPSLKNKLSSLFDVDKEKRGLQLSMIQTRFASNLDTELEIVKGKWLEESRAVEEIDRLTKILNEFLSPKRKEYDLRVGSFREFLDQTVPAKIEALVLEASQSAEIEVRDYLSSLRGYHWATLRAAVVHGGAYVGSSRSINLPDDIANYFQGPMAAVWGQKLLKDIRNRTNELTGDLTTIINEIFVWVHQNGGKSLNKRLLNAQQASVLSQADQMKSVGKEAVDELRNTVKTKLLETIRKPIAKACEKFVEDGDARGPGVKSRILDLFESLATNATKSAKVPATKILKSNYDEVRTEITVAFNEWGDPIQETVDIIISKREKELKGEDDALRAEILKALEEVLNQAPNKLN
jgi:GTP-binding protein EngB required for normal cell division